MEFEAAIFDLDGTLLDSTYIWEQISLKLIEHRGYSVPSDYVKNICSKSFDEAADYTIKLFGLKDTNEEIVEEWNLLARKEYESTIRLKKYAYQFLCVLKKQGKKLAVATGLPEMLYEPCLKSNMIYQFFDVITSTDYVGRGKEHADIYYEVSNALHVPPEKCAVYEDTLLAIKSAKSIGMKVIGVYDQYSALDKGTIRNIADDYITSWEEVWQLYKKKLNMEFWDLYDSNRKISNIIISSESDIPNGMYHCTVSVWIKNSKGLYLMSKRHHKKIYPNYWECTGGSVLSGENSLQAGIREVQEELGIDISSLPKRKILSKKRELQKDFYDVYIAYGDFEISDIKPKADEVTDVQWMNLNEINNLLSTNQLHPLLDYINQNILD